MLFVAESAPVRAPRRTTEVIRMFNSPALSSDTRRRGVEMTKGAQTAPNNSDLRRPMSAQWSDGKPSSCAFWGPFSGMLHVALGVAGQGVISTAVGECPLHEELPGPF